MDAKDSGIFLDVMLGFDYTRLEFVENCQKGETYH